MVLKVYSASINAAHVLQRRVSYGEGAIFSNAAFATTTVSTRPSLVLGSNAAIRLRS